MATPAALGDPGNLAATTPYWVGSIKLSQIAVLSLPGSQSHLVDLARQSRSHLPTVPTLAKRKKKKKTRLARVPLLIVSPPSLPSQPDLTTASAADSPQQTKAHFTIPIPDTATGFSGVS